MDELKLLSDENRVRILRVLNKRQLCVCELELILKLSQPNISNHLNKLKEKDIVKIKKLGKWNYYYVNDEVTNTKLYEYIFELDSEMLRKDMSRLEYVKENYEACSITSKDVCDINKVMERI